MFTSLLFNSSSDFPTPNLAALRLQRNAHGKGTVRVIHDRACLTGLYYKSFGHLPKYTYFPLLLYVIHVVTKHVCSRHLIGNRLGHAVDTCVTG